MIAEDEDLSTDCKLGLLRLTCRVCDPLVRTAVWQDLRVSAECVEVLTSGSECGSLYSCCRC